MGDNRKVRYIIRERASVCGSKLLKEIYNNEKYAKEHSEVAIRDANMRQILQIHSKNEENKLNQDKATFISMCDKLSSIIESEIKDKNIKLNDLREILNYYQLVLDKMKTLADNISKTENKEHTIYTKYELYYEDLIKINKLFLALAPKKIIDKEKNISKFSKFSHEELSDAYNIFVAKGYMADDLFKKRFLKYYDKKTCLNHDDSLTR